MVPVIAAGDGRGQVVVLAAVVVAVALVAMATAYHGLGYHGDVRTTTDLGVEDPMTMAERELQRDVDRVAVTANRPWAERGDTVNETRTALNGTRNRLQRVAGRDRAVVVLRENSTVATDWATNHCPQGVLRAFGPCFTNGGIVVQERANETVLVGVALTVTRRSPESETTATLRVRAR